MRGTDEASGSLFSHVDLEERVPAHHPLRKIRAVVNDALSSLDERFNAVYVDFGCPSIVSPERLIRASLIQILFSIRSERQLMEQMHDNLLFRWLVGLTHRAFFGDGEHAFILTGRMLAELGQVTGFASVLCISSL